MIHEVSGDILLSRAAAIAHGVAPGDSWKSGLALALRERFPGMVSDFRNHCHGGEVKCGDAWLWSGAGPTGYARFVSLLTQEPTAQKGAHPGQARLEHVNGALRVLREIIQTEKLPSVALPRLATGAGGLRWADVRPLIEKHLGDLKIPVYVYTTYREGVAAAEPAGRSSAVRA